MTKNSDKAYRYRPMRGLLVAVIGSMFAGPILAFLLNGIKPVDWISDWRYIAIWTGFAFAFCCFVIALGWLVTIANDRSSRRR